MRTKMRNTVLAMICFSMTAQAPSVMAQQLVMPGTKIEQLPMSPLPTEPAIGGPAIPSSFAALRARAEAIEPIVNRLRAAIDRTQFDPTALNSSLGFDPAALARFVTNEIHFEQYPGVLRGAAGTLMGRAGNALDQSILLGHLLDEAGMDWRIARGALSSEDAERLINQMTGNRDPLPPAGDVASIRQSFADLYRALGYSEADISVLMQANPDADRRLYESVTASDTDFIVDALGQAGVELGDRAAISALIEEARDYYWVEYRTDAFEEWNTVHPAFGKNAAPSVGITESFTTPPSDLYHRIRFEVFIEQKSQDKLVTNSIFTREGTVVDLVGKPFVFGITPDNLVENPFVDLREKLRETGLFFPSFNSRLEGNAFDLDGRSISVSAYQIDQSGLGDVLRSQAKQLEIALGGLEGLGDHELRDASDVYALTAVWIEYGITVPGKGEKTHQRYLMDRIGMSNREAGIAKTTDDTDLIDAALTLPSITLLSVASNKLPDSYAYHRFAERLSLEVDILSAATSPDSFDSIPSSLLERFFPLQDVALTAVFDLGHDLSPTKVNYRSEPTVVALMQGQSARVDVVNHARRFFDTSDGLLFDPLAAVRGGVWDSFVERTPLLPAVSGVSVAGTEFRKAQTAGSEFHVFTPTDSDAVAALDYSPGTTYDIRDVLRRGHAVIVSSPDSADQSDAYWWRVNPKSGEVLGMMTGGYGIASVEATVARISMVVEQVLPWYQMGISLIGFTRCASSTGRVGCCAGTGALMMAFGKIYSFGIGTPIAGAIIGTGSAAAGYTGGMCGASR